MARQFNGTSDVLTSASNIAFASTRKVAVAFWLWWDSYANDGKSALACGSLSNTGYFRINPNGGAGDVQILMYGKLSDADAVSITRPSAAAWHHYVANFDITQQATHNLVASVYVDGADASPSVIATESEGDFTIPDNPLYLMSFGGGGFGAGRQAECALYREVNLSLSEAQQLYGGALATDVQGTNLAGYWNICGNNSPEMPTVSNVALLVTGTTQTAHPPVMEASCSPTNQTRRTSARRLVAAY